MTHNVFKNRTLNSTTTITLGCLPHFIIQKTPQNFKVFRKWNENICHTNSFLIYFQGSISTHSWPQHAVQSTHFSDSDNSRIFWSSSSSCFLSCSSCFNWSCDIAKANLRSSSVLGPTSPTGDGRGGNWRFCTEVDSSVEGFPCTWLGILPLAVCAKMLSCMAL